MGGEWLIVKNNLGNKKKEDQKKRIFINILSIFSLHRF